MGWLANWYLKYSIYQLGNIFASALLMVWNFFSIPTLLKTLGAPWKRDLVRAEKAGLNKVLASWSLNFVSRLFGFLIRAGAILLGTATLIISVLLGGLLWLELVIAPISLPLLLIGTFNLLFPPTVWVWGGVILVNLLLVSAIELKLIIANLHYPPTSMPLNSLLASYRANTNPVTSDKLIPFMDLGTRKIVSRSSDSQNLLKLLAQNPKVRFILDRALVGYASLATLKITTSKESILRQALIYAVQLNHNLIEPSDILLAIAKTQPDVEKFFEAKRISTKDLISLTNWQNHMWRLRYPPGFWLEPQLLRASGGLGASWSFGYTPTLLKFGRDITQTISRDYHLRYLAHKRNVAEIKRILSRSGQHNCLVVGAPGVGKRTTIEMLAWDISWGKSAHSLMDKRLIELDVGKVASLGGKGEISRILIKIFNEATASGNIILFVENIERLFSDSSLGAINAFELLMPYLRSDRLQLIGTATPKQLHKMLDNQPALEGVFEEVQINEPNAEQTLSILEEAGPFMEGKYDLLISYLAIKETIQLSDRYLPNLRFPQKSVGLLDEVCAQFSSEQTTKIILPEHIRKVVSSKTQVPVGDPTKTETLRLLNLEKMIHQRLINQTKAVQEVAGALKRARAGTRGGKRPVGSFLFLGPTGVGKTQMAKTLANIYYGGENKIIRLDMSEYQTQTAISLLLGDTSQGGFLTKAIADQPFSLVLLDEIEKAHPRILDIFLQVLDEGLLKDGLGRVVSFRESIIIATSNAGANLLRQKINLRLKIGQMVDMDKISRQLLEYIQNKGIFRPEFLNRFDAVIPFRTLTISELKQVASILLAELNQQLRKKQIKVKLTSGALEKIARMGFDPEYGARALERVMREKVENQVAEIILNKKTRKGATLTIDENML